jgi:hypothetical protein
MRLSHYPARCDQTLDGAVHLPARPTLPPKGTVQVIVQVRRSPSRDALAQRFDSCLIEFHEVLLFSGSHLTNRWIACS